MSQQTISNDDQFLLFKEVYFRLSEPKAKKEALQLVNSSVSAFAEKGIDAYSMSSLSRFCGVTPQKMRYCLGDLEEIKSLCVKFTRFIYQSYVLEKLNQTDLSDARHLIEVYVDACLEWPEKMSSHTTFWIRFLSEARRAKSPSRQLNTEATKVGLQRLKSFVAKFMSMTTSEGDSLAEKILILHTLITGQILCEATEDKPHLQAERKKLKQFCVFYISQLR